jgi:hypothetical protein
VKAAQRSEAQVRTQWRDYCDTLGGGTRDPRMHTAEFLRNFFQLRAANALPQCQKPLYELAMPAEHREDEEAREILVAKVKHGQRSCENFRKAWWDFCDRSALGVRDPAQHSCAALHLFFRHVPGTGRLPDRDPYSAPPLFQCPLAKCVKVMQSSKMKWKRQWDSFCDEFGAGIKDPARHPPAFLESFIMSAVPKCPERLLQEYLMASQPPASHSTGLPVHVPTSALMCDDLSLLGAISL